MEMHEEYIEAFGNIFPILMYIFYLMGIEIQKNNQNILQFYEWNSDKIEKQNCEGDENCCLCWHEASLLYDSLTENTAKGLMQFILCRIHHGIVWWLDVWVESLVLATCSVDNTLI